LMQGLADGYFVIPYTLGHYLASNKLEKVTVDHPAFVTAEHEQQQKISKLLGVKGKRTVDSFHRELGMIMWNNCGMARTEAGLKEALARIPQIREEFWQNVTITGSEGEFNRVLERAGRVADFLEFAQTMVTDALDRKESCGGHFREESQTQEGEAKRDDENFCHVSAWEYQGVDATPILHKEALSFENVPLTQRSYK